MHVQVLHSFLSNSGSYAIASYLNIVNNISLQDALAAMSTYHGLKSINGKHIAWILLQIMADNRENMADKTYTFYIYALKSDSTHHFFRNACTKSESLRFSQFSGC